MIGSIKPNPYIKPILLRADLPKSPAVLRASIYRLTTTLLGKPEDLIIPGIYLKRGETLILNYLLSCDQVTLGSLNTNSGHAQLSTLRTKLRKKGIHLPREGKSIGAEDKQKMYRLMENGTGIQRSISDLTAILSFDPTQFDENKLPQNVPELQAITLRLIELLRGHPEVLVLPEVTNPSEIIILSTILARRHGLVTHERISVALHPIANAFSRIRTRNRFYTLRANLIKTGIEITEHGINRGQRGLSIDRVNRLEILSHIIHPNVQKAARAAIL